MTVAVADRHPFARREHDRAGTDASAGLAQLREDAEAAGLQPVVDDEVDHHRPDEVVALVAGVLAGRLAELGAQRLLDVGEAGVVARAEVEGEHVGDDAATLDVDAAVVVHLAQQPPAELDRADGAARSAEHTLDHTLHPVLERLQTHEEHQGSGPIRR